MRIRNGGKELHIDGKTRSGYPVLGIAAVMVLLFLAMFISWYLVYAAFLICIFRVVRYDARVFSADYCMLLPVATLFQTSGGMSLMVYLCLFAAVWYIIRSGIRANPALVLLLLLLNYMILRMQMQISKYVLLIGQLMLMYILLPHQDVESAECTAKAFCVSLFLSSVYALIFRNTSQMYMLRGNEAPAYFGSSVMRFQGLFEDPNYYMVQLIVGIALLLKLRDSRRIKRGSFLAVTGSLAVFGVLTYSKTFFLLIVLLAGIYVLWQFRNRKVLFGTFLVFFAIAVVAILLIAEFSPLAVILTRFTSATSIGDLTTGRTEIFLRYWTVITENMATFLFGAGFEAARLGRDTHNLYLEIMYYSGAVGLAMLVGFYWTMVRVAQSKTRNCPKQNVFAKYVVLLMLLIVFCALHGIFSVILFGVFYLAFLSVLLTKKSEVD